jgi:hypothetical protein
MREKTCLSQCTKCGDRRRSSSLNRSAPSCFQSLVSFMLEFGPKQEGCHNGKIGQLQRSRCCRSCIVPVPAVTAVSRCPRTSVYESRIHVIRNSLFNLQVPVFVKAARQHVEVPKYTSSM